MNCPQCQAALQPGMETCPSCSVRFSRPVVEGQTPIVATDDTAQAETAPVAAQQNILVQQVTQITGIPANLVPKWRLLKPVALVACLAPAGLLILLGLLVTGEVYKPERGTEFFQPLSQDEKIKLGAVATGVQTVLFVLLLSI